MKQLKVIAAFLIILVVGCSSHSDKNANFAKSSDSYDYKAKSDLASPPPPPEMEEKKMTNSSVNDPGSISTKGNTGKDFVKKEIKKIIKTAEISVEVENYKNVKASIVKVVDKWEGYISRENEENNEYKVSNSIDIRVPSENFEKISEELVTLAKKLDYKRVNASDITDQYYDTKTRLESNKRVEQSYLDLLKRANSIGDILEIQTKLGEIREDIESKEGQIKRMDDQVGYSTITLLFYELHDYKYIPEKSPGFFARMAKSLHGGWEGFISFFVFIIYLWPLWLFTAIGVYILLRFLRKGKKKEK